MLAMGVLAGFTVIGTVDAQTTSPLLNTLEVRTLIASAEPADHTTLARHFATLADGYDAEARRQDVMATSVAGNPSRNFSTGRSAHGARLARLNTASATTLRELATHHEALAPAPFPALLVGPRRSRQVGALRSRSRLN